MLINFLIATKSKEYDKTFAEVSHADMQRLLDHNWPGNVRELKNVIERSVIVSEGSLLRLDWWDAGVREEGNDVDDSLVHIERDHILHIMQKCHWKINGEGGAARLLGMNPNTLRSKMKRLGIRRPGLSEDLREDTL